MRGDEVHQFPRGLGMRSPQSRQILAVLRAFLVRSELLAESAPTVLLTSLVEHTLTSTAQNDARRPLVTAAAEYYLRS